jgi:hypothetical protein
MDLIKKLKKIGTDEEVANDDLLLDLLNSFKENIKNKKLKTAKEIIEVFSNILQGHYQAAASSENPDLD